MDIEEKKAAIEAILFAAGREVKVNEIMSSLEIGEEEAITILNSLASDFNEKKIWTKNNKNGWFIPDGNKNRLPPIYISNNRQKK